MWLLPAGRPNQTKHSGPSPSLDRTSPLVHTPDALLTAGSACSLASLPFPEDPYRTTMTKSPGMYRGQN